MKRLLLAALAFSCKGAEPPSKTVPVSIHAEIPLRGEVALVELGDATFTFDRSAVTVMRGGKIAGHGAAPVSAGQSLTWGAAATIAAPDGEGRWVVGIAGGKVWRITTSGGIEAIDERIGVADAKVLAVDSSGTTSVIGLVGGAVVSNNGTHAMRFAGHDARAVAAARDRVAIATKTSIEVFDLATNTQVSFPVEDASYLAFLDASSSHSRLIVVVGRTIYEEDHGSLKKSRRPEPRQVAVSGSRLWILTSAGLYAEDVGGLLGTTLAVPEATRIFGSRTGDVWVSQASHIARYSLDTSVDDPTWHRLVEPVFQHTCSHCHLAGGSADLDLSTPAAWAFERSEIIERVLVAHTMPPTGTELSEPDRQALATWLKP